MDVTCGICEQTFNEKDITRVTPANYLGANYPEITNFCPICFQKFLTKTQPLCEQETEAKISNLKNFVNS